MVMECNGPAFDDAAFARRDVSRVEALCLYDTSVTDAGIELLRSARQLRELHIASALITDEAMEIVCNLPALDELSICDAPQITDLALAKLGSVSELYSLNLSGTRLTDKGLSSLSSLTKLEVIVLNDTEVTDVGTRVLESWPLLRTVSLARTRVIGSRLAGLPNNDHFQLYLDGSPIIDDGIVAMCKNLEEPQALVDE